jgi:uncharacterized protein
LPREKTFLTSNNILAKLAGSMQLEKAGDYISELLKTKLPSRLHYHDFQHTIEVHDAAVAIASKENISNGRDLVLLRSAALFHDCGYLNVYDDHEEESCRIAREVLPQFGYTDADIEVITAMIMKTKVPQVPETLLQKILCDADLDHLGREDFKDKSIKLYHEWKETGRVSDEESYNKMQISFIESHRFWTETAIKDREPAKQKHLEELKALVQQ